MIVTTMTVLLLLLLPWSLSCFYTGGVMASASSSSVSSSSVSSRSIQGSGSITTTTATNTQDDNNDNDDIKMYQNILSKYTTLNTTTNHTWIQPQYKYILIIRNHHPKTKHIVHLSNTPAEHRSIEPTQA